MKTKTQHTPGPWTIDCGLRGQNSELVFGLSAPHSLRSDEIAANARLIAAAPELLAALRDIQTMSEGTCSELVASIHRIATEAIAKYEGE